MKVTVGYPNGKIESPLIDFEAEELQYRYPEWFGLRSEIQIAFEAVGPVMRSEPGDFTHLPKFGANHLCPGPDVLENAPRYDYIRRYPSNVVAELGEQSAAQRVYVYAAQSTVQYRVLIEYPYWKRAHEYWQGGIRYWMPAQPYTFNGQHTSPLSVSLEVKLGRVERGHDRWLVKDIVHAPLGHRRFKA
jgi:hypothetical protein